MDRNRWDFHDSWKDRYLNIAFFLPFFSIPRKKVTHFHLQIVSTPLFFFFSLWGVPAMKLKVHTYRYIPNSYMHLKQLSTGTNIRAAQNIQGCTQGIELSLIQILCRDDAQAGFLAAREMGSQRDPPLSLVTDSGGSVDRNQLITQPGRTYDLAIGRSLLYAGRQRTNDSLIPALPTGPE